MRNAAVTADVATAAPGRVIVAIAVVAIAEGEKKSVNKKFLKTRY